jgi:hypothetical protein
MIVVRRKCVRRLSLEAMIGPFYSLVGKKEHQYKQNPPANELMNLMKKRRFFFFSFFFLSSSFFLFYYTKK